MIISADRLRTLVAAAFSAAGSSAAEAETVARRLVDANLVGHDSHGVMRVFTYINWAKQGKVAPNQTPQLLLDQETFALIDAGLGYGQVMGEFAMNLAIEKARQRGVAVVALRNSAHLGHIGDWAIMAADAGLIGLHFVNTTGLGLLTAPYGGIDRRLSANPFAVGVPVQGARPIVLDISGSSIAEGKIRVALHKGVPVPEGCIIDHDGNPTTDPKVFYGDPPGAILPFGGHKGFGLTLITEILAGAVTGGGCSRPGIDRLEQGMLSIVLDPLRLQPAEAFFGDVRRFVDFVKSSRTVGAGGEILIPGEPEERTRASRLKSGIDVPDTTWNQILEACASVGLSQDKVQQLAG